MHFVRGDGVVLARRNPAIAPAQHAQESRPAFVDDFAADRRGILLAGHAPAQVHVHQMNPPLEQFLPQPRENKPHQMIPLRLHVAEG